MMRLQHNLLFYFALILHCCIQPSSSYSTIKSYGSIRFNYNEYNDYSNSEEQQLRPDEAEFNHIEYYISFIEKKRLFVSSYSETTRMVSTSTTPVTILPYSEILALQDLYIACEGQNWNWDAIVGIPWPFTEASSSSLPPSPYLDPCLGNWEGVLCSCNQTGGITEPNPEAYGGYGVYYSNDYKLSNNSVNCSIINLHLDFHNLRGTIPPSVFQLANLTRLHLGFNYISGSMPQQLGFYNLDILDLHHNRMTGELPSSIGLLLGCTFLVLNNNDFTSSLPASWGALSMLRAIYLSYNNLHGSLPNVVFQQIRSFAVLGNSITGVIPSELFQSTHMILLYLGNNHLSGTISDDIGSLTSTYLLHLNSNYLSGSIPSTIGCISNLLSATFSDNLLSSSIPSELGTMYQLQLLDMSNNSLTGSIPSILCQLVRLEYLFLRYNRLSGSMPDSLFEICSNVLVFGSTTEYISSLSLVVFDISSNQITGSLPSTLFTLQPQLSVFAASFNCFTGSLPQQAICSASNLTSLILNGLHSSPACQVTLSPYLSDSYLVGHSIGSTIPSCFFSLPNLTTLQLSGNGIGGNLNSLNSISSLSKSLINFVASHNQLSSTIPAVIQLHPSWNTLDLSFNKFGGTLMPQLTLAPESASLRLIVNRLSGIIPASVINLGTIAILEGNKFSCGNFLTLSTSMSVSDSLSSDLAASQPLLPPNDPAAKEYSCGSAEVNFSLILWIGCICLLACCFAGYYYRYYPHVLVWRGWMKKVYQSETNSSLGIITVTSTDSDANLNGMSYANQSSHNAQPTEQLLHLNLQDLGHTMTSFRVLTVYLSLIIVCIFVPLYGALSAPNWSFRTFTFSYAWTISAAFLQGAVPAALLIVSILGVYSLSFFLFNRIMKEREKEKTITDHDVENRIRTTLVTTVTTLSAISMTPTTPDIPHEAPVESKVHSSTADKGEAKVSSTRWRRVKFVLIVLFNCGVVAVVNGLYNLQLANLDKSISRLDIVLVSGGMAVFKLAWNQSVVAWLVARVFQLEQGVNADAGAFEAPLRKKRLQSKILLHSLLMLVNNIIIPSLAVLFVSPFCFEYVLSSPPTIETSYVYPSCTQWLYYNITAHEASKCLSANIIEESMTFYPPYFYSFQCSSSLLTAYSPVFAYMFLINSAVAPLTLLLVKIIVDNNGDPRDSHCFRYFLRHLLPSLLHPQEVWVSYGTTILQTLAVPALTVSPTKDSKNKLPKRNGGPKSHTSINNPLSLSQHLTADTDSVDVELPRKSLPSDLFNTASGNGDSDSSHVYTISAEESSSPSPHYLYHEKLFSSSTFSSVLTQSLAIIMTFGIAFPPLAILGCVSILIHTYILQFIVARFYCHVIPEVSSLSRSNLNSDLLMASSATIATQSAAGLDTVSTTGTSLRLLQRLHHDFEFISVALSESLILILPVGAVFIAFFAFDTIGDIYGAAFASIAPALILGLPLTYIFWARCLTRIRTNIRSSLTR